MGPNRPHPLAWFAYLLCGSKRGAYASSKPHFCQISWALSLLRHQSRNSWVAAAFLLSEVTAPGYTMFLCVLAGTVPTICTPPKRYTSEVYTKATSTSPDWACLHTLPTEVSVTTLWPASTKAW